MAVTSRRNLHFGCYVTIDVPSVEISVEIPRDEHVLDMEPDWDALAARHIHLMHRHWQDSIRASATEVCHGGQC